jgi:hypothetical protein
VSELLNDMECKLDIDQWWNVVKSGYNWNQLNVWINV